MKNYYYTVSSRWQSGEIEIVSERLQRRDEIALKCNDFFICAIAEIEIFAILSRLH
jgi:hypothetical protein